MDASISYGFLQIVSDEAIGHTGGLLLVDQDAKPTEFHCTAPVSENSTQKILYGETWASHVFCDLIGAALVEKSSCMPELLFIGQPELIQLAGKVAPPVLMVKRDGGETANQNHPAEFPEMLIDGLTVSVLSKDLVQFQFAKEACDRFTTSLTLDEPFERIRQAIGEAQQVARQSDAA